MRSLRSRGHAWSRRFRRHRRTRSARGQPPSQAGADRAYGRRAGERRGSQDYRADLRRAQQRDLFVQPAPADTNRAHGGRLDARDDRGARSRTHSRRPMCRSTGRTRCSRGTRSEAAMAWSCRHCSSIASRRSASVRPKDTILYALSVGVGSDPLDANQLHSRTKKASRRCRPWRRCWHIRAPGSPSRASRSIFSSSCTASRV